MTSAIKKAAALAEHIPSEKIERLSRRLALVSTQLERESASASSLLGIEGSARNDIADHFSALKFECAQLRSQIVLGARYHLLSMEPLKWRDENGWPRLVVFGIDSPYFEIKSFPSFEDFTMGFFNGFISRIQDHIVKVEKKLGTKTTISFEERALPDVIQSCYGDVLLKLEQMSIWDSRKRTSTAFSLSCRFEGLIPQDIRQKIVEAQRSFKEVFVIAEVGEIKITERKIALPIPAGRDPLAVGFDGSQLWLIADFETTPVEEAMIFSPPTMKGGLIKCPRNLRKRNG